MVKAKIQAAFIRAAQEHADILVFPEMLGNEEILSDAFFGFVSQSTNRLNLPLPSLTLMPTWWHDNKNELYLIDGTGQRICIQQKNEPFILPVKSDEDITHYAEDLLNENKIIHILHIPMLGRFAFPICRDYLEPSLSHMLVQKLKATFLICPSFSTGKTQFRYSSLEPICYGCYTIWINSCAAGWHEQRKFDYIGIVSGPQSTGKILEELKPCCDYNCGDTDKACVFLIDISTNYDGEFSYVHFPPV